MLLRRIKTGKHFHNIIDLFFLFRPCLVQSHLLSYIQQLSRYHKIFSLNPFIDFVIIYINQPKFHCFLFLCIIIIEFHFRQKQLSIIIILNFKISSARHKSHYFRRISIHLWSLRSFLPSSCYLI